MKNRKAFTCEQILIALVAALAGLSLVFPTSSPAQTQGNNAVYYQSGSSATCCQGSGAFIDASVLVSAHSTICSTLYGILSSTSYTYPSEGAVIDARGLNSNISGFSMTCATGTTPWSNGSTFVNVPSTILLPAGTIVIPTTWVLPNSTTLIGVGDALPSTTSASSTTIQACKQSTNSCSFTGSDMIDLGTSFICDPLEHGTVCNGLLVQNLVLDGQGQTLNGIVNTNAQNNSSVIAKGRIYAFC